jgi:hypothetical protein
VWKVKSGTDLSDEQLKNYGVCSNHFHLDDYRIQKGDNRRGVLYKYASPTLNMSNVPMQGIMFGYFILA